MLKFRARTAPASEAGMDAQSTATDSPAAPPAAPAVDPATVRAVQSLDERARDAASSASGVAMTVRMVQGMMGEIANRNQKTLACVEQSRAVTGGAAGEIGRAVERVDELSKAVAHIAGLAELIQKIALQTNLLALNARIEAAHAGAAGAGFAVVANEVMDLAARSTAATKDISQALNELRVAQGEVAESIATARSSFAEISSQVGLIAANVEEDRTVVDTVSNFTTDAAGSVEQIATTLEQLASVAAAAATTLSGQ